MESAQRSLDSTNNNFPLYRFLKTFLIPPFRFQKKNRSLTYAVNHMIRKRR